MPLAVTFGGVGIMRLMLGASALFIVSLRKQTTFFLQFRDGLQHAHIQCSNGIVCNDAYFHVHVQISSFDVIQTPSIVTSKLHISMSTYKFPVLM